MSKWAAAMVVGFSVLACGAAALAAARLRQFRGDLDGLSGRVATLEAKRTSAPAGNVSPKDLDKLREDLNKLKELQDRTPITADGGSGLSVLDLKKAFDQEIARRETESFRAVLKRDLAKMPKMAEKAREDLVKSLKLTETQVAGVKLVIDDQLKAYTEALTQVSNSEQMRDRAESINREAGQKIRAILTPEQQQKFDAGKHPMFGGASEESGPK